MQLTCVCIPNTNVLPQMEVRGLVETEPGVVKTFCVEIDRSAWEEGKPFTKLTEAIKEANYHVGEQCKRLPTMEKTSTTKFRYRLDPSIRLCPDTDPLSQENVDFIYECLPYAFASLPKLDSVEVLGKTFKRSAEESLGSYRVDDTEVTVAQLSLEIIPDDSDSEETGSDSEESASDDEE